MRRVFLGFDLGLNPASGQAIDTERSIRQRYEMSRAYRSARTQGRTAREGRPASDFWAVQGPVGLFVIAVHTRIAMGTPVNLTPQNWVSGFRLA